MAAALSDEQLERYLAHVGYPRARHAADELTLVTELMARQISRVPFESFKLHYSQERVVSLDLEALFDKIVVRAKGGYCMELNGFFAAVLRALGFTVLNVAARVHVGGGKFSGWTHMINIVTIKTGDKFAVDVGFGRDEALVPIPLVSGVEFTQVHPQRGRLEHRALAQHTDPTQRMWVYSSQAHPGAEWVERNCFNEVEWFAEDYRVSNYHTMYNPTSFFVQNVLAFRGSLNEATGRIDGLVTLFRDTVKRQMEGQEAAEVVETLKTEAERVAALEKYFGVVLTPVEQRGIQGLPSELHG
ncbi:N-acetyltransferase family protein [Purpureocillium lavendulum]|uniref:N-acetyltransferase family protein n=1 Tax=Purpureocillium lavendulum TaxID=1247861 RepID=A0AB34FPK6_9HYPO|nr:N-acetyltransferase family protein [Purpureocillium lavendulum]